jgi:hypothetical protein
MVYGCGCAVVGKPNHFTTSTEMRFFWLHVVDNELQRGTLYPHLGMEETLCLLWIFWFLLLDLCGGNGGIGLASIIFFPLSFPLSGSDSESEHASDSEAFNSATSDCLARHSLVL